MKGYVWHRWLFETTEEKNAGGRRKERTQYHLNKSQTRRVLMIRKRDQWKPPMAYKGSLCNEFSSLRNEISSLRNELMNFFRLIDRKYFLIERNLYWLKWIFFGCHDIHLVGNINYRDSKNFLGRIIGIILIAIEI